MLRMDTSSDPIYLCTLFASFTSNRSDIGFGHLKFILRKSILDFFKLIVAVANIDKQALMASGAALVTTAPLVLVGDI